MKNLFAICAFFCCISCATKDTQNNKRQTNRENIVNVQEQVQEIICSDVLIGAIAQPYVFDSLMMIVDYKSTDKLIHVFNKDSFQYLYSFADFGQGPEEIAGIGAIAWNPEAHEIYAADYGQRKILSYNIDSIAENRQSYSPNIKLKFMGTEIPDRYHYVNDTLVYGAFVKIAGSSFQQTSGKWNMTTGEVILNDYIHPDNSKKRIAFDVSPRHDRIIECNRRYDLITLYKTNGELLYNIYGPNWNENGDSKEHFSDVAVCNDKIIASYVGEDWQANEGAKQFHVFNMEGDYLKTLVLNRRINRFCCDESRNRLIINFDSEMQFGYLDLSALI